MARRVWVGSAVVMAVLVGFVPAAVAFPPPDPPPPKCHNAVLALQQFREVTVADGADCVLTADRVDAGGIVTGFYTTLAVGSSHIVGPVVTDGTVSVTSSTADDGITVASAPSVTVLQSHVSGVLGGRVLGHWTVTGSVIGALESGHGGPYPATPTEPTMAVTVCDNHILGDLDFGLARGLISTSRVDGDVALAQLATTNLCDVHVKGDVALIEQQPDTTSFFGGTPDGSGCTNGGTVLIEGSLDLEGNYGPVDLRSVIIDGNLTCSGNAVTPELGNVTVLGTRSGQCR
jgi:hypothetical protein